MRLGMQVAFGRVRRKTEPTGAGVKIRAKNGELNDSVFCINQCGLYDRIMLDLTRCFWQSQVSKMILSKEKKT